MSDSVRPHGLQPTRLPHPWNSQGKNTGVGFHFLLKCMKVKSESEVTQSCPTPSDTMTAAYQPLTLNLQHSLLLTFSYYLCFSFNWYYRINQKRMATWTIPSVHIMWSDSTFYPAHTEGLSLLCTKANLSIFAFSPLYFHPFKHCPQKWPFLP